MKLTAPHRFKILILGIALVMLALSYRPSGQWLDDIMYDFAIGLMPKGSMAHNKLVIIAITPHDERRFGPWPWPRQRVARMIDVLGKHRVQRIGLLLDLDTPQTPAMLPRLREELRAILPDAELVQRLTRLIDSDAAMTDAISGHPEVYIAMRWQSASNTPRIDERLVRLAIGSVPPTDDLLSILGRHPVEDNARLRLPLPAFIQAARATGVSEWPRPGQSARSIRLAYRIDRYLLPSFALLMARGRRPDNIHFLRELRPHNYRIRPQPAGVTVQQRPFYRYTASELLQGKIRTSLLRGSIVIIGTELPQRDNWWLAPGGTHATPLFVEAMATATVLNNNRIHLPAWFHPAQRGLLLLLAVYLILIPARLHGRTMLIINGLLGIGMLNASVIVLLAQKTWLPLALPAFYLLGMQVLISWRHRIRRALEELAHEAGHVRYQLAINLQSQGQLDMAFDQLRQAPADADSLAAMYQLGLDFERRRQYSKALEAYHHIFKHDSHWRDTGERIQRLKKLSAPASTVAGTTHAATIVVDDPAIETPRIGRFDIQHELGRGAMGMVYLAIDPEIERQVAIKTLALTHEFEGKALEDARERFRREAAAAGRLEHPNIVGVHDIGEEHDIAYIAMDYAPGKSLDNYTDPDRLLPVEEVLEIGIQVADALDYAHRNKVVHRDIKPANLIYDHSDHRIRITDFGVASMVDDSRTRTGTVLGSPSYMSPEQVRGQKLDGRTDLYSLGVTLYQLLTGRLPFTGDSLANLMHRIINDRHKGIGTIRKGLPGCASRIVNKALQKDRDKRFQTGAEMKEALQRCLKKL